MQRISVLLLFLIAPLLALLFVTKGIPAAAPGLIVPAESTMKEIQLLQRDSEIMGNALFQLTSTIKRQQKVFVEQDEKITELAGFSSEQKQFSDDIYEQKILKILGPAEYAYLSDYTEIKIFDLDELGYRGSIAKVKLFDPTAFRVVLARDRLGKLETTSDAAKRYNAVLAINGGGFYLEDRNGEKYAQLIGNTVIDGKLVEPFNGYPGDLFFAGINRSGQVIGTVPQRQEDITALNPYQGVSFEPVLLQEGKKSAISQEWRATRQPRTIIGKYANDDLIMIVIDGRQGDWSLGITLEGLQDKLSKLGVKDAYNLDGGGSSVMYYNGSILNRPSDGKERNVVNSIVILR